MLHFGTFIKQHNDVYQFNIVILNLDDCNHYDQPQQIIQHHEKTNSICIIEKHSTLKVQRQLLVWTI